MISFTELAQAKLNEIAKEEGYETPRVRVRILGGGCAGFQYDMYFDEIEPTDMDETSELKCGILVQVDPLSLQYLDGTEIDYVKDEFREGFKFKNPNISAQCGCGSSFSA